MAANAFVRARIDAIAKEKALPFEMRVPNVLTAATLDKSERGEDVCHAKDAEDLFRQLGIRCANQTTPVSLSGT